MDAPSPSQPFLVFGAPVLHEDEIREVVDSLRSGWLGSGPKVARFEQDFAAYKGAGHPVAVGSCTAALHLSMLVAGIGPGDEVITTPLTFCSTINAILHAGATPVLADVDPVTMNIDPDAVRAAVGPATRAILPVHFAGRPCAIDALVDIAAEHDLRLIEDCAHAVEARVGGRPIGTFGDFGCFSFYVTKNVTTGEGGMVLARNEEDAARIKRLALHGLSADAWNRFGDQGYKHYFVVECGFKYNMMDIAAALGIHQLKRVDANLARRQAIWTQYDEALADLPLQCPAPAAEGTVHSRHLYTILVDEERAGISRDAFLEAMTVRGIGLGVHYLGVHEHPYYQERFGWRPDDHPASMAIGRRTVSLPLSPGLTDTDVARVVDAIGACLP